MRGRSLTRRRNSSRSKSSRSTLVQSSRSYRTQPVTRTWPLRSNLGSFYFDPFPAKMRNVLRYSETVSLDAGVAAPAHNLFRATSIFDPNFTGSGHQPYGHDTLAGIYNHYIVDKAICTVTSASTSGNVILGIAQTDDAVVSSDFDEIREQKGVTFAPLAASTNPIKLVSTYNRKNVFPATFSDSLTSNYNANPPDNHFFDVFVEGNLNTANPAALVVCVTITYYITSWELRDLGVS